MSGQIGHLGSRMAGQIANQIGLFQGFAGSTDIEALSSGTQMNAEGPLGLTDVELRNLEGPVDGGVGGDNQEHSSPFARMRRLPMPQGVSRLQA